MTDEFILFYICVLLTRYKHSLCFANLTLFLLSFVLLCISSLYAEAQASDNHKQLTFTVKHQQAGEDGVQALEENESDDDIDVQEFYVQPLFAFYASQTESTNSYLAVDTESKASSGPIYIQSHSFRI